MFSCLLLFFFTKRGRSFLPTSAILLLSYICRTDHTIISIMRWFAYAVQLLTQLWSLRDFEHLHYLYVFTIFKSYPRYYPLQDFHRFEQTFHLYITIQGDYFVNRLSLYPHQTVSLVLLLI